MNRIVQGQSRRLDVIQALRILAALSVVFVHLPTVGEGAFGIDLFFVISGFIMAFTTASDSNGFFLRRVARIVPLYWLFTGILFVIAVVRPEILRSTTSSIRDLALSLLFIPFDKNGSGTFPVLFLGWTLNYEMYFYLLFALSIAISGRHRISLASLFLVLTVVISGLLDRAFGPSTVFRFYGNSILLEFIFGMLAYEGFSRLNKDPPRTSLSLLIVVLFVGSLNISSGIRALDLGIPVALLFYFAVSRLASLTIPSLIILLGDASYSLYLSHSYVIEIFDRGLRLFDTPGVGAIVGSFIALVTCLAVSVVLYRGIEKPLHQAALKLLRPWLRSRTEAAAH